MIKIFGFKLGRESCEEGVHDYVDCDVVVRKRVYVHGAVVADYAAVRQVCRRCRRIGDMVIGKQVESYTGCTMPREMWEAIDRDGYVVLDGRDYARLRDDSREVRRI